MGLPIGSSLWPSRRLRLSPVGDPCGRGARGHRCSGGRRASWLYGCPANPGQGALPLHSARCLLAAATLRRDAFCVVLGARSSACDARRCADRRRGCTSHGLGVLQSQQGTTPCLAAHSQCRRGRARLPARCGSEVDQAQRRRRLACSLLRTRRATQFEECTPCSGASTRCKFVASLARVETKVVASSIRTSHFAHLVIRVRYAAYSK